MSALARPSRAQLGSCGPSPLPRLSFCEPNHYTFSSSSQVSKHGDVIPRCFLAGKFVDDVLPPIGPHLPSTLGVLGQIENRFRESLTVLRFHENAGAASEPNPREVTALQRKRTNIASEHFNRRGNMRILIA